MARCDQFRGGCPIRRALSAASGWVGDPAGAPTGGWGARRRPPVRRAVGGGPSAAPLLLGHRDEGQKEEQCGDEADGGMLQRAPPWVIHVGIHATRVWGSAGTDGSTRTRQRHHGPTASGRAPERLRSDDRGNAADLAGAVTRDGRDCCMVRSGTMKLERVGSSRRLVPGAVLQTLAAVSK